MFRSQHVAVLGAVYLATVWAAPIAQDAGVEAASSSNSPAPAATAQSHSIERRLVDTVARALGQAERGTAWRLGITSWMGLSQLVGRAPDPHAVAVTHRASHRDASSCL